jgi:CheY-like chemotaxis protein
MPLFILAVIVFIIADILIRTIIKKMQHKKIREERAAILEESLKIDYSKEAKTLKRAEVDNPKAKILCVDDEPVILDSFRKILVLEGYYVDTVEKGSEALHLVRTNHYDFVFTDLKMPEMDGVEVTKAVKHIRPDIDVIIITGFASVDTAVETMKFGAMDYVEKPFTEDELLDFVNKCVIKRQDRIEKYLKPQVHITHYPGASAFKKGEFSIPGGIFISTNHCWLGLEPEGNVKIGIDDFAKKLIGKIDDIDLPNLGMSIKKGQIIFSVKQKNRSIAFKSPVSGKISKINHSILDDLESLDLSPYEDNWICRVDANDLDVDVKEYKIGKSAIQFFQEDIEKCRNMMKKVYTEDKEKADKAEYDHMHIGELETLDDYHWEKFSKEFFNDQK